MYRIRDKVENCVLEFPEGLFFWGGIRNPCFELFAVQKELWDLRKESK